MTQPSAPSHVSTAVDAPASTQAPAALSRRDVLRQGAAIAGTTFFASLGRGFRARASFHRVGLGVERRGLGLHAVALAQGRELPGGLGRAGRLLGGRRHARGHSQGLAQRVDGRVVLTDLRGELTRHSPRFDRQDWFLDRKSVV